MASIKSALQIMLACIIAATLFSCGGSANKATTDTAKAADTTKKAAAAAPAAMAAPFDISEIAATVKDYAKWRPGYNGDSTNRKNAGMQDIVVGQNIEDVNNILVVEKLSDVAKTKAFAVSPALKDSMKKHGVISKPEIQYFHVVRFNGNSHEKQWVTITHKVKDFDAWVKGYDGEGVEKRKSAGEVDVAIARGIDDPNLVQVVFDITNMAKAKADILSEEKKKLMISAGVLGTPVIRFYQDAK